MIRILIVASARFYRESLAELLPRHPGLEIVGTVSDVPHALMAVRRHAPDVILLDAATPAGSQLVRSVREGHEAVAVVVLAVRETADGVLPWAERGISGYVSLDDSLEHLVDAVNCASRGELRCDPRIAGHMLRRLGSLSARLGHEPYDAGAPGLTVREREVLRLISEGFSNKGIARTLDIALSTAKNHVHSILQKLGVSRRAEAAVHFRRYAPERDAG